MKKGGSSDPPFLVLISQLDLRFFLQENLVVWLISFDLRLVDLNRLFGLIDLDRFFRLVD